MPNLHCNELLCMNFVFFLSCFLFEDALGNTASLQRSRQQIQQSLLRESDQLLSLGAVSYVYGGAQVGDASSCDVCQKCLQMKSPQPKKRQEVCPVCGKCSLDCSHFVQLVYKKAGISFPYLTTDMMLKFSPHQLNRHGFVDLGIRLHVAQAGDLLVYRGHVVMLERLQGQDRGDVIHATGGRDIKGPGHGIQRERFAPLRSFRGPLLKILRHKELL